MNALKKENVSLETKKHYSREEQLNLFGYIAKRSLTEDDIQKLNTATSVLRKSKFKNKRTGLETISYSINVYFSKRLVENIRLTESQYNTIAVLYDLDIDSKDEFKIAVPYRLFTGISRKTHNVYYNYEIVFTCLNNNVFFLNGWFNNEKAILIQYTKELMNELIKRTDTAEEFEEENELIYMSNKDLENNN